MNTTDIEQKVIKIVSEFLGVDESKISAPTNIYDIGADSLDAIEIVMALEDEFEMAMPDEAIEDFETINQMVNYIQQRV